MKAEVYEGFQTFIHGLTGVKMRPGQTALLRARIAERMKALELEEESEYLRLLKSREEKGELRRFINAITTNTTSFFRTEEHFQVLRRHLKQWMVRGGERYRVWSSASSTGEEPWSIAMTIAQTMPDWAERDMAVLATDIDTDVLARAKKGVYSQESIKQVPEGYRSRYFLPEAGNYVIQQDLKRMVTYGRLNLSHIPYPMKGPFDAIFCRNVLIYFDQDMRTKVLAAMIELLHPRGLLILGPSESALGMEHLLRRTTDSVYMLRRSD